MKKPGLNKLSRWTLENSADDIIWKRNNENRDCYYQACQYLIDKFIPAGWVLFYKDIDQETFFGKMDDLSEVLGAAETILAYNASLKAHELVRRLTNPIVNGFTRWLKHEFDLHGKEVE